MLHKLIENKRNKWLNSGECTVSELLKYIEQHGVMRDAQSEAIKTYLFCGNQPLWKLFVDGVFNDTNIGQVGLTETARQIFSTNKAAVALYQPICMPKRQRQQATHSRIAKWRCMPPTMRLRLTTPSV